MKSFFLFLSLSLSCALASATNKCNSKAESYLQNVGNTQPARLIEILDNGLLVYEVRSNQNGGDAAYEVIVDNSCRLISTRLLWSE